MMNHLARSILLLLLCLPVMHAAESAHVIVSPWKQHIPPGRRPAHAGLLAAAALHGPAHLRGQFHASLYHDPTCAVLAQLPGLRRIQLDFVTDEGAMKLAALPNLERLTLGDSLLSPATVRALARCRTLRQLEINGPWSYAILDSLKGFPHLKTLVWTACPDGRKANDVLRAALPDTKLELSPGNSGALEAAWEKSVTRLRSRAQLAPFLAAARAYREQHPFPKAP